MIVIRENPQFFPVSYRAIKNKVKKLCENQISENATLCFLVVNYICTFIYCSFDNFKTLSDDKGTSDFLLYQLKCF